MRSKITFIAMAIVATASGVLLFNEKPLNTDVEDTTPTTVTVTALTPEYKKPSTSDGLLPSGTSFALYDGIKTLLDRLIFEANSEHLNDILAMARRHCQEQNYRVEACEQFTSLYTRYVNYKYALMDVDEQHVNVGASSAEIDHQFSRIEALQRQYFSYEEQDVLFSADNKLNEQALARRAINNDPNLSKEQKERLIIENLEQLPEEQKRAFQPSLNMQKLAAIKDTYQDRQQRLIEVENQFGHEAAQRLEKRWREREVFQNKVKQIASQYQAIADNKELSPDKIKTQQQAFLAQHFSENQQKRVRVMLENSLLEQ
ncbi:hypothetical protein EYS14_23040 [Alteromonadaceae bacterium M269]|nr:hypothetical protein EYS14_23040 [Alteromonadaceae bacterium M269]